MVHIQHTKSLISVIIPTYNRADLIGETLESIIAQTYLNWECIVVDDGSTDYTAELMFFYCEKDERVKFFERPKTKNKGANACRNFGFQLSNGEFVNWFDSDDIMHPEFLKKKIEVLHDKNGYCCISEIQRFSVQNGIEKKGTLTLVKFKNLFEDLLLQKIAIGATNPMWRKSFLNSFKLFDEELQHSQDLEFHSRIFLENDQVEVIEEALLYVRTGHNSISEDFKNHLPQSIDAYLEARKRIVNNTRDKFDINKIIIRQSLSLFRFLLCKKQYCQCEKILSFIENYSVNKSLKYRLVYLRLLVAYYIFKTFGKGETRFKRFLYLP